MNNNNLLEVQRKIQMLFICFPPQTEFKSLVQKCVAGHSCMTWTLEELNSFAKRWLCTNIYSYADHIIQWFDCCHGLSSFASWCKECSPGKASGLLWCVPSLQIWSIETSPLPWNITKQDYSRIQTEVFFYKSRHSYSINKKDQY